MKDFLGNEYGVGDKVIYAAMSGRSVTMVLAEVVEIFEGPKYGWAGYEGAETQMKVKVQPLNASRREQHSGRTRYIDTRTGKGIDPFARSGKHLIGNYYEHDVTGEKVYREHAGERDDFPRFVTYYDWGAPDKTPEGWHFVKQEFASYVREIKEGPKPVTLTVTENIVLWQRKDSEQHPEWTACRG